MATAGPRKRSGLAALVCGGALLWAAGAAAQYPYSDAPRPPGSVPGRPAQPQYPPPPPQYQQPYQPPPQYPPAQPYQQQYAPPPPQPYAGGPARPAPIQGEDPPAPGGAPVRPTAMNPPGPPPQAPPPVPNPQTQPFNQAQPPGQTPPPGRGQARPAGPPADVVTAPPPQRIANPTAVFNGLDKITGRLTSFESAIGETVQFGALQVTARACYSRPPTETPLTDGFVEVDEVALQGDVRRIFTGWMFAASPGLHAVEHAVYDIWLVDCKGGGVQAAAVESPAAASPPRQPRQGGGQQRPPQQRQPAAVPPPPVPR